MTPASPATRRETPTRRRRSFPRRLRQPFVAGAGWKASMATPCGPARILNGSDLAERAGAVVLSGHEHVADHESPAPTSGANTPRATALLNADRDPFGARLRRHSGRDEGQLRDATRPGG